MATQNLKQLIGRTDDQLLDQKQAAERLTVSPGTLAVWRCTGRYNLPFVKVGRVVRYRSSDLDAWLNERAGCTRAAA
jgi:excisionase family DNA binding protein